MEICITSIGTANPAHKLEQNVIADFMESAHQLNGSQAQRLKALYRATGIKERYTVLEDYAKKSGEFEFFGNNPGMEPFPNTGKRMALYRTEALRLAISASKSCISASSHQGFEGISHIISVSCTGMYAPGIDIDLVNSLGIKKSVQRVCINFMGCYAAFNALKSAHAICLGQPNAKVLVVCTELCSLHFQKENKEDNYLANALFGDGAAAALVETISTSGKALAMKSFYCDLLPQGASDMAWTINNFGFEMKLSAYVPDVIQKGIKSLVNNLTASIATTSNGFGKYAVHPGGKKILKVIEEELGIEKEQNAYAYKVLKSYGNMSSATILFVLKLMMNDLSDEDTNDNILALAFGPGITLESMVLEVY